MNKLIILAKNPNTYFIKRLRQEWDGDLIVTHEFSATFDNVILVRNPGIYRDDSDLAFLNKSYSKVINTVPMLWLTRSKWDQYNKLIIPGLSFPPTLDLRLATEDEIKSFSEGLGARAYCLKPHYGQGGWGVRVCEKGDLFKTVQDLQDREFILQPYVEHSEERRCVFFGSDYYFMKKIKGGYLGNHAQGAEAERLALDDEFLKRVQPFIREHQLFYGAFDYLVTDKGEYHLLELNLVPGTEQLESVHGTKVMEKFSREIKNQWFTS